MSDIPELRELLLAGAVDERTPLLLAGGTAVAASLRGPHHEDTNEDCALVLSLGDGRGLIAVADGAGSYPQGELASRRALEALATAVREAGERSLRDAVLDGFEAADAAVRALKAGAATTLVAVSIEEGCVRTYNSGDSAAILCGQRGRRKHETVADSPTGFGQAAGLLDEDEAFNHPERHLVCNLLGIDELKITIGPTLEMAPKDTLVVASDGLWDNLKLEEVVELARTGGLEETTTALIAATRARMSEPLAAQEGPRPDDLTLVLFRLRPGGEGEAPGA
ncbi:MAG: PP2C family serine/threonine-protein phosphatase [Planctomycetota bacterium]